EIPEGETLGSYLWARIQDGKGARARHDGEGAKLKYDFYVERGMVEREFEALWEYQTRHHPALLTDQSRERIHAAIFDQRPLKPVDPGRCRYEVDEKRAPLALQSTQLFRIYQEVNGLRVKN